jgi:hypothetical protein
MLTVIHVRTGHRLLVLDAGIVGAVTGSKKRWREFLPQK